MKRFKTALLVLMVAAMLAGCAYFDEDSKTLIDYRYSAEYTAVQTDDDGKMETKHYNEKFELLYEYTYADGHTERRWEECTRFEYAAAKEELGEIEP